MPPVVTTPLVPATENPPHPARLPAMNSKLVIAGLIIVASIAADQITKLWAEATLASPRFPDHTVELVVAPEHDGKTLREVLEAELTWTSDKDLDVIAGEDQPAYVKMGDRRLRGDTVLEGGDELTLELKTATIIPGFWDHHYARNPGAAFSFLADAPESIRRTFFIAMSTLAVGLIGFFIYRTEVHQGRLRVALALVLGGAVGNLIDRVAYGYVIDFIAWHVGEHYWPTFNIADAVIVAGIGLLAIEIFFGMEDAKDEGAAESADERSDERDDDEKAAAAELADSAAEPADDDEDERDDEERARDAEPAPA